jgi:hypothetical protein
MAPRRRSTRGYAGSAGPILRLPKQRRGQLNPAPRFPDFVAPASSRHLPFKTAALPQLAKQGTGPAMWLSVISVIQCCTEFVAVYPNDVELARCCTEAWKPLSENTFIGRVIWNLRTRKLLRAIR